MVVWTNCGGGGGLVAKLCPTLVIPWTAARQAPLSTGFSKQEYWSGLPFPSPGNLPSPGIEPTSLTSPTLAGGASLPLAPPSGKPSNKLFATEQETEFGSEKGVLGQ